MKMPAIQKKTKQLFRLQFLTVILTVSILLIGVTVHNQLSQTAELVPESSTQISSDLNLLRNASFEDGFYWKPPNHYVADEWNRWWIHGSNLPEYTDSSTGTKRPHLDGNRAQAWHIWDKTYTAGIYQVTHNTTPCTLYNLSAWSYNSSLPDAIPHARLGLDPDGTALTDGPSSGAILHFPPRTVWSRDLTTLYAWEQLSVIAESLGKDMTAILYTSPEQGNRNKDYFYDTSWDAATLVQIPFPDNRLPEPTGWGTEDFIYNVKVTPYLSSVTIEWNTQAAASTQVWYEVVSSTLPVTQSIPYSYTTFLPLISKPTKEAATFRFETKIDSSPVLHHQVTIHNLPDDNNVTISYVALSRYADENSCTTKATLPDSFTFQTPRIHTSFLPLIANNLQTETSSSQEAR